MDGLGCYVKKSLSAKVSVMLGLVHCQTVACVNQVVIGMNILVVQT
jgi:hypothetical protein